MTKHKNLIKDLRNSTTSLLVNEAASVIEEKS